MTKKYKVTLTAEERDILAGILNKGRHGARKCKRAQALLLADGRMADDQIAERAGMHRRGGVENLRRRFVEDGFEAALEGKPHGHRPRSLQGEDEARLAALVCSPKPGGYDHWTLRLLRDTWVTP
jgi:transposase